MFFNFIPSAELNDFARLLANVLRDFNPDSMFWCSQSPIVYPNYNKDGFEPPKAARKSFGVQTLLECFARSSGFNSYKAMLTKAPQYSSIDLSDLDPYPRNSYYSTWWRCFISSIVTTTFKEWTHKTAPSYLTYRNFKHSDQSHIAPFMFQNIPFLKTNEIKGVYGITPIPFEDVLPLNGIANTAPVHYLPFAMSMLLTANEIGFEHPIPLRQFLVHEQWYEANVDHFFHQLNQAFELYFNSSIKIAVDQSDLLNSSIEFELTFSFNEQLEFAKSVYAMREKLKALIGKRLELSTGDNGYYTHPQVTPTLIAKKDFPGHELRSKVLGEISTTGSLAHQVMYGTKAFWLNQAMVLMLLNQPKEKRIYTLLNLDDIALEQQLDSLVLDQLKPYTPPAGIAPVSPRKPYFYHFHVKGITRFKQRSTEILGYKLEIPKTLTIYSDYPLPTAVARLAAQGELLSMFPNEYGYDFDGSEFKSFGDPCLIEFESDLKLTLKQVEEFPSNSVAEKSADFDLRKIIKSVRFERCDAHLLYEAEYYPHTPSTSSVDDRVNFGELHEGPEQMSYTDFIFARNADQEYRACKIYLYLIDVPYVANERYSPLSGMNELSVMCQWDTSKGANFEAITLDLLRVMNHDHAGKEKDLNRFVNYIEHNDQFKALLKDSLEYANQVWEKGEWFYQDSGTEYAPLHVLYHETEYVTSS